MKTAELDYALPATLIAQHPVSDRDGSRMMVLDRAERTIRLDAFRNLPLHLRAGDCLVLNDTRVIRARLQARKSSGGRVEVFLLREMSPCEWEALVRPSARVRPGTPVQLAGGMTATIGEVLEEGRRHVTFDRPDVIALLEDIGGIPLPPYIHRSEANAKDATHYQTVYATSPGAVAAPTAGLHFTPEVFAALDTAGIRRAMLTLHVGYGTFKPITEDELSEHRVDPEYYSFSESAAALLNDIRATGGRIAAVGTTSTRVLETVYRNGRFEAGEGVTNHYIYPPYAFHAVDMLQTNFHLPKSSLLALVCAFAGRDFIMEAYRRAVEERFRFYSYGDVMLIL